MPDLTPEMIAGLRELFDQRGDSDRAYEEYTDAVADVLPTLLAAAEQAEALEKVTDMQAETNAKLSSLAAAERKPVADADMQKVLECLDASSDLAANAAADIIRGLLERPSNGEVERVCNDLYYGRESSVANAIALLRKLSGAGAGKWQPIATAEALEIANRIIRTAPEIDPTAARVLIANIAAALIRPLPEPPKPPVHEKTMAEAAKMHPGPDGVSGP